MKKPVLSFILSAFALLIAVDAYSQIDKSEITSSTWNERGLTLGANYYNYLYGEVGYFQSKVFEVGGLPLFSTLMNYGVEFSNPDEWILAPKVQARVHFYLLDASISFLYYTNLDYGHAFRLRPEVGLGLKNIDLNYGYNIPISDNNISSINFHNFTLRYYLSFSKKNVKEYLIKRKEEAIK